MILGGNEIIEGWKDIKDYEGYYQVSNLGNVKSLQRVIVRSNEYEQTVNEKILQQKPNRFGYNRVPLSKDGKSKRYFVHRLVAMAFIENPNNLPEINHLDENKMNNRVENLEWVDRKYNINYGSRTAKAIVNSVNTKHENGYYEILGKKVAEYNKTKKVYQRGREHYNARKVECNGVIFGSIIECAKYFNVDSRKVSHWLLGRRKMPQQFVDMGLKYAG